MKKNIYIAALEIGEINIEKGISFNELKLKLQNRGFHFNKEFELSFLLWYYENFYVEKITEYMSNDGARRAFYHGSKYNNYKDSKGIVTGQAMMNLLEYQELKEARDSSKKAHKIAIAAIIISGVFALASIIFQAYSAICN